MTNLSEGNRDFAVVIGVDRYERDFAELKGAVRDAQKMSAWLQKKGGVPKERIFHAWSRRLGEPALLKVERAFDQLTEHAIDRPNRRLYVYFAGHGLAVEQNHANLLMADARALFMNRGIDAQKYQEQLRRIPWFDEQIFFYDCCRPDDDNDWRGTPPKWTLEAGPDAARVKQVVHFGTRWFARAYERPTSSELQHRGLFSTALLEGLEGYGP